MAQDRTLSGEDESMEENEKERPAGWEETRRSCGRNARKSPLRAADGPREQGLRCPAGLRVGSVASDPDEQPRCSVGSGRTEGGGGEESERGQGAPSTARKTRPSRLCPQILTPEGRRGVSDMRRRL